MNIPWKVKSLIFKFIDLLKIHKILYLIQVNLTSRVNFDNDFSPNKIWLKHLESLKKYNCLNSIIEFGAGKSLSQNLYFSNYFTKQILCDINKMLNISFVEQHRKFISNYTELRDSVEINSVDDLKNYGIEYKAPYDMRSTNFEDSSFDACITTDVLEHIPESDINKILIELKRILKIDGVLSFWINYSDHYSHTDKSITPFNFLKYSQQEWKKYNHYSHFQNRLRHSDFKKIFLEFGFDIIEEQIIFDEKNPPKMLEEKFKNSPDSWKAVEGYFLLKKN